MEHVRPKHIFTRLEDVPAERQIRMQVPPCRGPGGVTVLETCLLMTALKIVNARAAFEIGTFEGSTTLNIALDLPDGGRVFTLDLDAHSSSELEQHPADAPLTSVHLATQHLDFKGSAEEQKVTILVGNSTNFDFTPWYRAIDFVFIDGGHDGMTVDADTRNAFEMIRDSGPACIAWHDYGNPAYPELTAFLDRLSEREPVVHVADTALCFLFNEARR